MADYGRLILAAEEKFFNECNTGNGRLGNYCGHCHNSDIHNCCEVPVIAVLTKIDTLNLPALEHLEEEGLTIAEAMPRVADVAAHILSQQQMKIESQLKGKKYPPKVYLPMASE